MTELNESGTGGRKPRRRAMRQSGPPAEGTAGAASTIERACPPGGDTGRSGDSVAELGKPVAGAAALIEPADAPEPAVAAGPVDAPEPIDAPEPADAVEPADAPEPINAAEPADAPEPADAHEPADQSERAAGLGWIGWIAAAVAAVSALVLIGSGGFLIYHQRHVDALQQQRADYIQTAKQVVLNLTNISGDTAPKDIDRVLSVASGELKAEYTERKDAYAQVVQQAKVKATGQIIETALESEDDHTARVLVAAEQTLTNAGSPNPQQRYYRFRVTVTRDDTGHLTGSQVEFVA